MRAACETFRHETDDGIAARAPGRNSAQTTTDILQTFFFSIHKRRFLLDMASRLPISLPSISAPTPQNTPLNTAPISAGLSRPTVPDISEDKEEVDDDEDSAPKQDVPAVMMGIMQSKLASLVGKSSGYIEGLPVETKRSIEALKGIQVKQVELQNQYKRECLELERKVRRMSSVFLIRFDEPRSRPFSTRSYSLLYMHVVMRSSRARQTPPRKRSRLVKSNPPRTTKITSHFRRIPLPPPPFQNFGSPPFGTISAYQKSSPIATLRP
jgi:hypothetical protein